jgi:hypothetical protein
MRVLAEGPVLLGVVNDDSEGVQGRGRRGKNDETIARQEKESYMYRSQQR